MISIAIVSFLITSAICEKSVIPINYDVAIVPDLTELIFAGETKLTVLVQESVQNITLNAKNLNEHSVKVSDSSGTELDVSLSVNDEDENVVLQFSNLLENGLYDVFFNYSGRINEEQEGLYVYKYTIENGENEETRQILLTNFAYDKARQVFPCFDSPSYIATFSLSIVRPNDYKAVANMLKRSDEEYDSDRTKDIFAQSVPLPTYLVSFTIIDFNETNYENVIVYSMSNKETEFLGEWSRDVAAKFEETESFSLDKIQQIVVPDDAIPKDVLANIGLIIYRESVVLYNEQRENLQDKQAISELISYVIVRQWYKKATKFEWWSDFWVDEGKTVFYQYNVLEALQPSWRLREQLLVDELEDILEDDNDDHGISLALTEDETPEKFSKNHRIKSYVLVRMFTNLPFPGDILENSDNVIALSWTQETGYPILNVNRDTNNLLTFVQDSSRLRRVPVSIAFEDESKPLDKNFDVILENNTEVTNFSSIGSWYIVNVDRFGYFRTKYDDDNWKSITAFILEPINNIDEISPLTRSVLISDAFNLLASNKLSPSIYLDLIAYLKRETDYIPIYSFIKTANRLNSLLAKTNVQELFLEYARNLTEHLYEKLGTSIEPSESHLNTLSRIEILTWLCNFGSELCQKEMYEILSSATESLNPNLQEPAYCGGMRLGNLETFGFLQKEHNKHQKDRILRSMACTSNAELLRPYILAMVDESATVHLEHKHKQVAFSAIIEGSDNGVDVALVFVKQYLEQILSSFTVDEISTIFVALSEKLVTEDQLAVIDEIILCLNETQNAMFENLFTTVKNNVKANIEWRSANVDKIRNWFNGELTTTTTSPSTPTTPISTTPSAATVIQMSVSTLFTYLLLHYAVNNCYH